MRIRRIKLSGFKSFVEPAELHVEPGLTGIVGPNGCGKSNLLEAIRWVMGESSARSMRGGGMDDVIFAGTATRPAREFAEVALLAERSEAEIEKAPFDDKESELEVVRRIERGAGSAYRANGRDVRAKDVALIFADAATGAHSPALVSQGKIASVISAKPVERRMMLEEAAGIAGLHVRRKDAEQKLRAAEANLARLADILADMDTRANQLRRQAKAAERYRRLSTEIRQAEARLIFSRWRDARAAAELARREADTAGADVAAAQTAQDEAMAQQRRAAEELAQHRTAHAIAREESALVAQQVMAAENEARRLNDRLRELRLQQQRLEEDCGREDRLTRDAAEALERLRAEAARLGPAIVETERGRPPLERDLALAEQAVRDNEVALARALAEQARVQADLRIADSALSSARQRYDRAETQLQRIERERGALGDPVVLEQARDQAQQARIVAEGQVVQAGDALSRLESEREQALAGRDAAQGRLAEARAGLSGITAEIAALERDLAKADDGDAVLGRIRVVPGYEAALAAALGEDVHAALGAGRRRGWAGIFRNPGDAPVGPDGAACLADHVEAPDALMPRLRQIWVVDSDSGQSLAIGQRLVTRAGRLRRWDGFVSSDDGAAAAERLKRANRLDSLRSDLPGQERSAHAAGAAVQAHVDALAAVDLGLRSARQARSAAEENVRQAVRAADAADHALIRLRADSAALAERIAELAAEQDVAARELVAAQAAHAALPDAGAATALVARLTDEGNDARERVQRAHAALSEIDQRLAQDRERRAVAQAEIRGWQARAGEAEQRLADMRDRLAQIAGELAAIADRPAPLEAEISALKERRERTMAELASFARAEQEGAAALRRIEEQQRVASEALSGARERRAGAEARAENQEARRTEMGRISGDRFECPPPLLPERLGFAEDEVGGAQAESDRLERLQADRERIGPVNLIAADELAALETEQATGAAESEELQQAINRLRGSIGSLNREGRQRLLSAFEQVDQHFQRLFATLFNGGRAHLELVESDDPLEAGLEIMAQPPGKRLSTLTLLSGGEQALTAVALIFGLFLTNPAPICVLDEVDAPLDDANIERFCDLLDRMVRETDTRYLIVTHNAVTMSRMHRLFGVTMIEQGISRLVSVDLGGAEELLAAE